MKLIPIHVKRHNLHFEQYIHKAEYKAKGHRSEISKRKERGEKRYIDLGMSQPIHERLVRSRVMLTLEVKRRRMHSLIQHTSLSNLARSATNNGRTTITQASAHMVQT